jgi:CIC family chloride channel protein
MMLAIGIAYVGLRRFSLYPAQVPTRSASPAHRGTPRNGPLLAKAAVRSAQDLLVPPELAPFAEHAPLSEIAASASGARNQRVVALGVPGGYTGLVELSTVAETPESERHWMKAHDARVPFVFVRDDAAWPEIAHLLDACGLSQVPVVSGSEIVGWVGDRELRRAVLDGAPSPGPPTERR